MPARTRHSLATPAREGQWASILQLSKSMLSLAQQARWDDVARLQVARQEMLEAFFAEPVAPDEGAVVAARIREIMELDERIKGLGQQGLVELGNALKHLDQGRKATQAYGQHR